jgi:hypothetical protein
MIKTHPHVFYVQELSSLMAELSGVDLLEATCTSCPTVLLIAFFTVLLCAGAVEPDG